MEAENRYQETDLGNISPNPRGAYSADAVYEYLDLVEYQGGSYLCLAELGTTCAGISPEPGKNTESWQILTVPGGLTPEYVTMHDRVHNLAEQVAADAEEVRTAKEAVEGMETNIRQMQVQTAQSAESAEASKDSAAGYAHAAEVSRQAAETAEANVNAQISGFDRYVEEKTAEAKTAIETARIAANEAVVAQQVASVQEIKDQTAAYISEKKAEAEAAIEAKAEEYAASVEEDIKAVEDAGAAQINAISAAGAAQTEAISTAGAEQVEAIGSAGSAEVAALQEEGATQVAAVQEAAEAIISDRDKIAANSAAADAIAIKGSASGSNITLDDASDLPLSGLKLYGRSTQATTEGYNLIDLSKAKFSGCELISEETGTTKSIITDAYFCSVEVNYLCAYLLENKGNTITFAVNNNPSGTRISIVLFGKKEGSDESRAQETDVNGNMCRMTISANFESIEKVELRFNRKSEKFTDNTSIISGLRFYMGDDDKPFEPYTGGQPSPNPDYPQEIVSVGDKGSVETKIYGKNLFDAEKYVEIATKTEPGTEVVTFDGRRCLHIPTKVSNANESIFGGFKIGGNYRLEYEMYAISEASDTGGNGFCFKTERGVRVYALITKKDGFGKWAKIERETKCKESMGLYAIYGMPNECYIDLDSIKLVEGNDMECEPCAVQTLTMQTPNGLCGIPVASGGNYTDEDGQQWICDEVDFERGVYVQRIRKIALTGAENIQKRVPSRPWMFYLTENTGISNQMLNTGIMCTHFRKGMRGWTEKTSGEIMNNTGSIIFTWDSSKSVADFKAMLEEQYESGKQVTAQFILGNLVEIPIPPEELAAYRALHSNKPITNIINDEGAHMDVGYTADTERYINKNYVAKEAYDALEQRVAALETNAIS